MYPIGGYWLVIWSIAPDRFLFISNNAASIGCIEVIGLMEILEITLFRFFKPIGQYFNTCLSTTRINPIRCLMQPNTSILTLVVVPLTGGTSNLKKESDKNDNQAY